MQNPLLSPKIRLAFVLPTLLALAISVPLIWIQLRGLLQEGAASQLVNTLPVVARIGSQDLGLPPNELQERVSGLARENEVRITLMSSSGEVLADSARTWSQVQVMDNHAERPEIIDAMAGGSGTSVRRSDTTGLDYVYAATTVADSTGQLFVVRLAQPLRGLATLRRNLTLVLAAASLVALAAMMAWLWWLERQVVRASPELLTAAEHLQRGEFDYRIDVSSQNELGRLGRFLNKVAQQADQQVTELRTQREHLLSVVSSMQEGVLVTDAEGFTRLANQGFRKLFGIHGEVEGRTPLELTRQPQLEDRIIETLTKGESQLTEIEIDLPTPRNLAIATSSLGPDQGALVVARDITELVRLTQMRRDFVANVSHELKTPLTAIRGYAETLRDGALDEPDTGQRFLGRILQQCSRLQALLEDLLTLSRLESLEGKSGQSPVSMKEVLDDCLETLALQVAEREIEMNVDAKSTTDILGDRDALERLVINLLDNALKYNRPGGLVTARLAELKGEVVLEVSDSGIGIPTTAIDRVFERFYRVDKGRSREEGGTGLGLAIVKHVAQLHGGRVEVESKLGEGTIFRVHLPSVASL